MVVRNGVQEEIPADHLVPGDLVVLNEGDAVPADLRLVEVAQLAIVEAILTGESEPASKNIARIRSRVGGLYRPWKLTVTDEEAAAGGLQGKCVYGDGSGAW